MSKGRNSIRSRICATLCLEGRCSIHLSYGLAFLYDFNSTQASLASPITKQFNESALALNLSYYSAGISDEFRMSTLPQANY
jgi:hypothetical protein